VHSPDPSSSMIAAECNLDAYGALP